MSKRTLEIEQQNERLTQIVKVMLAAVDHESETKGDRREDFKNSYPFVPLEFGEFQRGIEIIIDDLGPRFKNGKTTFVDAGCGNGSKLVVAAAYGFDAIGVEQDSFYIRRAKRLFSIIEQNGQPPSLRRWKRASYSTPIPQIVRGNILKHDFSKYDVVFFYRPFYNDTLQHQFETKLHTEMKPGAYLFAVYQDQSPPTEMFQHIDYVVYRKRVKGYNGDR